MIDHKRKLIFIHLAKTGGSGIETSLISKDWWQINPTSKHLSAQQAKHLYGDEIWEKYITLVGAQNGGITHR